MKIPIIVVVFLALALLACLVVGGYNISAREHQMALCKNSNHKKCWMKEVGRVYHKQGVKNCDDVVRAKCQERCQRLVSDDPAVGYSSGFVENLYNRDVPRDLWQKRKCTARGDCVCIWGK